MKSYVGHVQNRVGTRLRKINIECKELMQESFYAGKKDKKTEKAYVLPNT